jgi:hypothetical protein
LTRPRVIAAGMLCFYLVGCSTDSDSGDPSIVLDKERAPSELVENGTAYDRAAVEPGRAKKVVLPDTATVQRTSEPGLIRLFMSKRLGFSGHPKEPISIRAVRKDMGCAIKVEGDALMVATFGEWDSHIEGGYNMKLVVVVPNGLAVEQRKGLSGEKSAGLERRTPENPAGVWSAVLDEPDPNHAAK